jgi:hypothetical protein
MEKRLNFNPIDKDRLEKLLKKLFFNRAKFKEVFQEG